MDVLYYLTASRGKFCPMSSYIAKYQTTSIANYLRTTSTARLKGLERKSRTFPHIDYITTIRDVGYRLISKHEITAYIIGIACKSLIHHTVSRAALCYTPFFVVAICSN